jgi:hypothetical protein
MFESMGMKWTEYVVKREVKKNEYMVFVGKPERKTLPGRPSCRWMDNIMTDLRQID